MRMFSSREERRSKTEAEEQERLDSLDRPPSFNLKANPRALAEWFMALSQKYRAKFSHFLSDKDREFAREIEQKRMSEERYLSGFFVKKGKIVEVKALEGMIDAGADIEVFSIEDGKIYVRPVQPVQE